MKIDNKKVTIDISLDSGVITDFLPLKYEGNDPLNPSNELKKVHNDYAKITNGNDEIKSQIDELKDVFTGILSDKPVNLELETGKTYMKAIFGKRVFKENQQKYTFCGIWIYTETNTSDHNGNIDNNTCERGVFYDFRPLNLKERNRSKEYFEAHQTETELPENFFSDSCHGSPYIKLRGDESDNFNLKYHGKKLELGLEFEVIAKKDNSEPHDVDIFLDMGNTRTTGLLLKHRGPEKFEAVDFKKNFNIIRLKPLYPSKKNDDVQIEEGIIPSWFILHETPYQNYRNANANKEPSFLMNKYIDVKPIRNDSFLGNLFGNNIVDVEGIVERRIPQMFVRLSPCLVGDAAEEALNEDYTNDYVKEGANIIQSSPKRYYWDDVSVKKYWNMLLNPWDEERINNPKPVGSIPVLQGDLFRFINEDGTAFIKANSSEDAPCPSAYLQKPQYPRRTTLTWYLLRILEKALTQAHFGEGQDFEPHRLRNIAITHPAGWSDVEIEEYRARCQDALDIFSENNVMNGVKNSKDLALKLVDRKYCPDEAVAGQLPFIFSEIMRLPKKENGGWFELVGKQRTIGNNGEKGYSVRVLNLDIGGGTSDLAVIEYWDDNNTGITQNIIKTKLLYRDGIAKGGDDLMRTVIGNTLLKSLVAKGYEKCKKFEDYEANEKERAIRSRLVRTCLIPLANYVLNNYSDQSRSFSAKDAMINENLWDEFAQQFLGEDDELREKPLFEFNPDLIEKQAESIFNQLFRNCAMYIASYDVDMVVFSGKPSELPFIKKMAYNYLPIDTDRIVFSKDYKPGEWYPFLDKNEKISDAKTVTVVGVALYYALSKGLINSWTIKEVKSLVAPRLEWGRIVNEKKNIKMDKPFLDRQENDEAKDISLLKDSIIARRKHSVGLPEPMYRFKLKDDFEKESFNDSVYATFKREFLQSGESLSLKSVYFCKEDGTKEDVTAKFELKFWPCEFVEDHMFWQDNPQFDIDDESEA